MTVLILGAGGVVGQRLARDLAGRGQLRGQPIEKLVMADLAAPNPVEAGFAVETRACDITDPSSVAGCVTADVTVIYLLAAVVSSHAEAEFDDGYKVNMHGTLNVLERARSLGTCPVVVFSSSVAVFGGEAPERVGDETVLNPQTSYGTQKAIGELLLNDYSRKGYVDGRGFRLPTISVRPGKPNRAASGFMSSILREPLNGLEAVCPVGDDYPAYYLSLRRCVENLIKGAELEAEALGQNRCMTMPGRTWTIRQMIDALEAVAGPEPVKLIKWEAQPEIEKLVRGWRGHIDAEKGLSLGLQADASFEDNIRYYIEEELS